MGHSRSTLCRACLGLAGRWVTCSAEKSLTLRQSKTQQRKTLTLLFF